MNELKCYTPFSLGSNGVEKSRNDYIILSYSTRRVEMLHNVELKKL